MVILDIIAGIFMGILTGMGIGGGGLLVLYLTGVTGIGQLQAQGCNLLFYVFASIASLYVHSRRRRLDFGMIGVAAVFAVAGSFIGTGLSSVLPEEIVRQMFGWMLIVAGIFAGVRVIRKK